MKICLQKLKKIPIDQVANKLGLTTKRSSLVHCNGSIHKNGDRKPSLRLYPDTNSWYCFPCGKGGSVIDLVMHVNQVSVKDAINQLGEML